MSSPDPGCNWNQPFAAVPDAVSVAAAFVAAFVEISDVDIVFVVFVVVVAGAGAVAACLVETECGMLPDPSSGPW